jgi:hypothetical protein
MNSHPLTIPFQKEGKRRREKKTYMVIKTKYLNLVAIRQHGDFWSPLDGCGVISILTLFRC